MLFHCSSFRSYLQVCVRQLEHRGEITQCQAGGLCTCSVSCGNPCGGLVISWQGSGRTSHRGPATASEAQLVVEHRISQPEACSSHRQNISFASVQADQRCPCAVCPIDHRSCPEPCWRMSVQRRPSWRSQRALACHFSGARECTLFSLYQSVRQTWLLCAQVPKSSKGKSTCNNVRGNLLDSRKFVGCKSETVREVQFKAGLGAPDRVCGGDYQLAESCIGIERF
jgi:hypothetical protein